MSADSRPAGAATTVCGLRSPGPAAVAAATLVGGRGARRWPSLRLERWRVTRQHAVTRPALPDVVVDAPDEERGRRDRVVDAAMYLVAFAISTATLVDTWELHPPWLRPVAVVAGIATVVSLRWRRTHPGAVGIGVGAVSVVIITARAFVAAFNAAVRARGRDLAIVAGLTIARASRTRCSTAAARSSGSSSAPAC